MKNNFNYLIKQGNKPAGLFKVSLLLLFIVSTSHLAKAQKFKVGKLYYKVTSTSPNEVAVVPPNLSTPYWEDDEKPTGELLIPKTIEHENNTYSVTSIDHDAFDVCKGITSVTIPNSVKTIGGGAFSTCNALTSVNLSKSLVTIGANAFSSCTALTSITIPNSVTSIEKGAFHTCAALKSIKLSSSLISIGESAFEDFRVLTSIKIPNSVKSIGKAAFYKCSALKSIELPNDLTSIERSLFFSCSVLTSISIPCTVKTIGEQAFYNCSALTSIKIPDIVTTIGEKAFYNCIALKSITIPNSVSDIGKEAFLSCKGLKTIISKIENVNNVTLKKYVFKKVNKETCTLCVPKGKLEDYKKAEQWKDFENIIEIDDEAIITKITLSEMEKNLSVGEMANLTVTLEPVNASDENLTWTSTNPAVATIEPNGTITAIGAGNATIVVAYKNDETIKAECQVTVTELSSGIAENETKFVVYPTAVQTGFIIEHDNNQSTLEVYTIAGKKVFGTVLRSNKEFVNISSLQSGIYIVKVGDKTSKIIKM